MHFETVHSIGRPVTRIFAIPAIIMTAALSACSVAPEGVSIHDPYEQANRQTHELNVALDRNVLRPASKVTNALPEVVTAPVSNFADHVGLPGMVVNGVLQGDIKGAGTNAFRFVVNTIFGIGGLFDPADAIGIYEEDTDFGETLAVWGVPEGAYVVLPGFGPSTERDAVGRIVDFVIDPLDGIVDENVLPYATGSRAADIVITRGNFGSTVDSVLYESADSYAQMRVLYLDSRRYELGTPVVDAYADPYADPYSDPYFDPYEDQ